eukprot:g29536.t1
MLQVGAAGIAIAAFARSRHEKEQQEARVAAELYRRFFSAELLSNSPERVSTSEPGSGLDANALAGIRAIERYQKERKHWFMGLSSSAEHVGDTRIRVLEDGGDGGDGVGPGVDGLFFRPVYSAMNSQGLFPGDEAMVHDGLHRPRPASGDDVSPIGLLLAGVCGSCSMPSMEPAQLAQLETLCNALYNARSEAERAQAHQTLLPLVQNPQCMPQLQFVLAHTSSPHALIFAATGLMKLITSHWTSVSDQQKEEMRSLQDLPSTASWC